MFQFFVAHYRKLKIKTKLLISIIALSSVIYACAFGFMTWLIRNNEMHDAKVIMDTHAREYANLAKANINVEMNIVRGIAQAFMGYTKIPSEQRMPIYKDMLKHIAEENKEFLSVWANWELSTVDESWTLPYGRLRYTFYRADNQLKFKEETLNKDGDNPTSAYYKMKVSGIETVLDPYYYSYTKKKEDEILETSVCSPILNNGKFVGVVGVDLALDRFQDIVKKINPYEECQAFLIANNGIYVAHTDRMYIGKSIEETDPVNEKKFRLMDRIAKGEEFSVEMIQEEDNNKVKYYVSYATVPIGKSITPWTLGVAVPVHVLLKNANQTFWISMLVILFGLIILAILIWLLASGITKPLVNITNIIDDISKGAFDKTQKVLLKNKDELGIMADKLNNLIDGFNKTANFAKEMGMGNLNASFEPLGENDILGNSLLYMQLSLQKAEEEDKKRKIEDEKRTWATTGLANFADILRQDNDNLEKLSYNIIQHLVEYLKAIQGGLFIYNDDDLNDPHLELKACYAYDRQKFLTKKIKVGEGLAGICFQERKTKFLTEVPEGYLAITSGLGKSKPACLLIVPLILNDQVFGVIEIASLKILENYEIEFVEKLAESIASSISTVKINVRTAALLRKSQEQSEEMRAQEEEMRQNVEELNATQEEMQRKNTDLQNLLKTIDSTLGYVEMDLDGNVLKCNDLYLKEMGATDFDQLIGKNRKEFVSLEVANSYEYKQFWLDIINGSNKKWIKPFNLPGDTKQYWKLETFTPVTDIEGKIHRVICAVVDITEIKESELKLAEALAKAEETIKQLKAQLNK